MDKNIENVEDGGVDDLEENGEEDSEEEGGEYSEEENDIYGWAGSSMECLSDNFEYFLKNKPEIFTNKESSVKILKGWAYSDPKNIEYVFTFLHKNFPQIFSEDGEGYKFLRIFFLEISHFKIFNDGMSPYDPDIILCFTQITLKIFPDFFKKIKFHGSEIEKLKDSKNWIELILSNI